MRHVSLTVLVLLILLSRISPSWAEPLSIPITLDLQIVEQALNDQLYLGDQGQAVIYSDTHGCNVLTLSDPRVSADDEGRIRLRTAVQAQGGSFLGGKCRVPFQWSGHIESVEEVYVPHPGNTVAFRIVDSHILGSDDQKRVSGIVWDWVKRYVHPRLETVKVDLDPAVAGLRELMATALPDSGSDRQALIDSIHLADARVSDQGLSVVLGLNAPPPQENWLPDDAPFSDAELSQWDASWQAWDAFATWLIKTLALGANRELADALADILLDARYELRDALANEARDRDQVRALFLSTWSRLAPLLKTGQLQIPGSDALKLAGFVSATDALQALDAAAPQLGMRIDQATFRSLARLLLPTVSDTELTYGTEVDPTLRALLGLEPHFEEGEEAVLPFVWPIRRAEAAVADPALVRKLTGWIPKPGELDQYLASLEQLLDAVAAAEREKGKVPVAYLDVYDNLLPATAWQESCWRQFISKQGRIQPIQSSAGSVGLMQINKHVWRGVYDVSALESNIAYNARAGSEILVHYLVDYAIKNNEQDITGNKHDLARATYAIYNGGPRHMSRYRKESTSPSLRKIDAAFWKKYRTIQDMGSIAVKSCYRQ